ncbi:hypothetical protein [Siphonobacter curvatus]|uniref:Lipopolysaccharide biosynthesis protein n=1 Tax=Siphonobacter curvatus TaxID=2094562 RepID=A0A2S7IPG7_9BACT|nr:hypothetical protein [Siphonobacter curvatus]PQA59601.1 hypothetical protein C5O19_08165 [Siphonobacter curvatus]
MPAKPKFLLIAPWDYQLYVVIEKNLTHLGYEVVVVHNNQYAFTYKDSFRKMNYLVKKLFSSDKRRLKADYLTSKRRSLIQKHDRYEVTLVIRSDLFSTELLLEAKARSVKFISFFYDGLTLNPQVLPQIKWFDRFFIFDRTEINTFKAYGVEYAPNFYVDYPELNSNSLKNQPAYKIYYISSYHPSRIEIIQSFYKYVTTKLQPVRFDFVYQPQDEEKIPAFIKKNFNCLPTIVPYEEQLRLIKNTEIILDFKMDAHAGFSFRIFDGINWQKKVITTNDLVVEEDFYHPNNFFVLTETNEVELDAFLILPYVPLDPAIREKYSFKSWLQRVIDYVPSYKQK